MARHSIRLLIVLAITLFLSFKSVPFAQQAVTPADSVPVVPRLINFGGVLRDGNGQTLRGVVGVTLSLYKDQQGGVPLWIENQNVQLDEQGNYSVLLGATQVSGLPIDLFVSGESRWLGVQAQLPGTVQQPRVLLVSVPYALKAVDADTIGGKPASAFLLAQPADPTQPGNTSSTALKPRDATLTGATGTPNALTKWLNATGDLGDSKVYEVNGNVGVNNPNPIGQFDLAGASGLGAEAGGLHVTDTNVTPNKVIQIGYDDGSDVGFIRAYQSATGSKNLVLNPQGGNVGVGTTNPIGEFEVSTQATYNAEAGGFHVTNNATSPSKVAQMGYDNNLDAGFIRAYQASTGVKPLLLNPGGGFVGIGTTTPAATLDVQGGQINASGGLCIAGVCQTSWPSGTISGITAGTGLTGGGTSGILTLNVANGGIGPAQIASGAITDANINSSAAISPAKIAGIAATLGPNTFTGSQTITNGNLNLPNTANSGAGTLTFGGQPFLHNFGNNIFLGQSAGNFSTTGGDNIGIGFLALSSNTTGGDGFGTAPNVAIGVAALQSNTTGHANIAIGANAMSDNISGIQNVAIGRIALLSNNTGTANVAVGDEALYSNTSASGNSALGAFALEQNTTGKQNAAIGSNALLDNTTGNNNTALGFASGFTVNPSNANTTGSNNTFIGYLAGPGVSTEIDNATAIGANAIVSANNTLVLGAPGVSVAIGAATAGYSLDVQGGQINASGGLCIAGVCQTTWPSGAGTISGVTAGTGLTGGGTSGNLTLSVAPGGIGTTQLADSSVNSAKLADGSITNTNVSTSAAISPSKIAGIAAILGSNTFNGTQTISNGNLSLSATTSAASGVITIGGVPFLHGYGTVNTFVGGNAGNTSMLGNYNTATGSNALGLNTSGSSNTADGAFSLSSNQDGFQNTATGDRALQQNTSGFSDTAIGAFALQRNTTGLENTAEGTYALSNNTTANENTALGFDALASDTGGQNTAVGALALVLNTNGAGNTAIGESALENNTGGSNNTAVGYLAGVTANSGNSNILGSINTFIGYQSGPGNSTQLTNSTAIGANAIVSASNTLVLGAPGVSVVVGAATAATTFQVVGDIRVGNSGTNGCLQGFDGTPLAGTCSSDMRLKRNIESFTPVLDKVTQLQPVYYNWNTEEHPEYHFGDERTQGLIAQDVEKVFPNMVVTDERGYKAVNYSELPLLLLQAVRELKAENDALKSEIEALKAR